MHTPYFHIHIYIYTYICKLDMCIYVYICNMYIYLLAYRGCWRAFSPLTCSMNLTSAEIHMRLGFCMLTNPGKKLIRRKSEDQITSVCGKTTKLADYLHIHCHLFYQSFPGLCSSVSFSSGPQSHSLNLRSPLMSLPLPQLVKSQHSLLDTIHWCYVGMGPKSAPWGSISSTKSDDIRS